MDEAIVSRFADDLIARTLTRNVEQQRPAVISAWNRLVNLRPELPAISAPASVKVLKRVSWESLPATLLKDVQDYMAWCTVPDPLDENARATRLAPATIQLRRDQVHSAVTAAAAAGIPGQKLLTLADLVEFETFKVILRKLYKDDGSVLATLYRRRRRHPYRDCQGVGGSAPEHVDALKKLRRKLGTLPTGLTDKNKSFLRSLDNTQIVEFPHQPPRRAVA